MCLGDLCGSYAEVFFLFLSCVTLAASSKMQKIEETEEVDQLGLLVLCSGMFFTGYFKLISCCVGFSLLQSTELSFAVCLNSILKKAVVST